MHGALPLLLTLAILAWGVAALFSIILGAEEVAVVLIVAMLLGSAIFGVRDRYEGRLEGRGRRGINVGGWGLDADDGDADGGD